MRLKYDNFSGKRILFENQIYYLPLLKFLGILVEVENFFFKEKFPIRYNMWLQNFKMREEMLEMKICHVIYEVVGILSRKFQLGADDWFW